MTSNRAYRQAMSVERAVEELESGRGTQFEARVVDAFTSLLRDQPELATVHTDYTQDVDAPVEAGVA
jgi:HD-GYP domain-containing protein (c-di-GMP phosphodiesterase class II)